MDIEGLIRLLKQIESGEIQCIALDLPEPSPLAHEILNAKPYAFLDNAPLEERRTQAVYTRRSGESSASNGLGILDAAAIEKVCEDAFPRATNPDELHEALLLAGVLTGEELTRVARLTSNGDISNGDKSLTVKNSSAWIDWLAHEKRAGRIIGSPPFWIAAERLPMVQAIYQSCHTEPALIAPDAHRAREWQREEAIRELVRGRLEISGPVTARSLANLLLLTLSEMETALAALEGEGFVLRGKFHSDAPELEWCERRLLARIHRLTINRLRAEIQPVSIAEFHRFLAVWQKVDSEHRVEGPEGVEAVLRLLDGCEIPAAAWEPELLALRIKDYSPQWLDQLCFTGRIGWGRLSPPQSAAARPFAPVRSSPISLFFRQNLSHWLALSPVTMPVENSPDTQQVLQTLSDNGASFFSELVDRTGLLPSRVEQALAELATQGRVTSDSFEGLRALLVPSEKRVPFVDVERKRRYRSVTSVEFAGRWSLLRTGSAEIIPAQHDAALETFARVLLRRYGVVFRRMIERESFSVSWYDLGRIYRRLEAQGEIRGGYFVSGVSGEQFALPEAIGLLRSLRKNAPKGQLIAISGADPLNLAGILTPGPRVSALSSNRLLLRDGLPIAALEAGQVRLLDPSASAEDPAIERHLRLGTLSAALRPYYA
jgi:ATP-dependent Lhr-like helicase